MSEINQITEINEEETPRVVVFEEALEAVLFAAGHPVEYERLSAVLGLSEGDVKVILTEMAKEYGISPRKTASILDTFSCIFQGFLPYGAQMLVALSVASTMGFELSAFEVISHLYYPMLLLVSSLVFIFFIPERKK